jgi:hypothetical protein
VLVAAVWDYEPSSLSGLFVDHIPATTPLGVFCQVLAGACGLFIIASVIISIGVWFQWFANRKRRTGMESV